MRVVADMTPTEMDMRRQLDNPKLTAADILDQADARAVQAKLDETRVVIDEAATMLADLKRSRRSLLGADAESPSVADESFATFDSTGVAASIADQYTVHPTVSAATDGPGSLPKISDDDPRLRHGAATSPTNSAAVDTPQIAVNVPFDGISTKAAPSPRSSVSNTRHHPTHDSGHQLINPNIEAVVAPPVPRAPKALRPRDLTAADREALANQHSTMLANHRRSAIVIGPFPEVDGRVVGPAAVAKAAFMQSMADAGLNVFTAEGPTNGTTGFIHSVRPLAVPMNTSETRELRPEIPAASVAASVDAIYVTYDPAKPGPSRAAIIQAREMARDYCPGAKVVVMAPTLMMHRESGFEVHADIAGMGDVLVVWGRGSKDRAQQLMRGRDVEVVNAKSPELRAVRNHRLLGDERRQLGIVTVLQTTRYKELDAETMELTASRVDTVVSARTLEPGQQVPMQRDGRALQQSSRRSGPNLA
jgi:hypothetical protein